MKSFSAKYLIGLLALILAVACVVPGASAPVLPTIDPNAIGTIIMETAAAAAAQTMTAMPTATPTATATATPRDTNTPEPTPTNTIVFILFSPTARIATTLTAGVDSGGANSDDKLACKITNVSPANGSSFDPRAEFDGSWQITNIGKSNWDSKTVDYTYLSGDKYHKVEAYDLKDTVEPGKSTTIIVDMQAPKNTGTYTTTWALRDGATTFCLMSLTIVVK